MSEYTQLSKKFVKTIRISLGLNEKELALILDVSLSKYCSFEENPMSFGGPLIESYVEFLENVKEIPHLSRIFMDFVKFDVNSKFGSINVYKQFPLRIVKDDDVENQVS